MDILSHGLWAAAGAKAARGSPRLGSGNIKLRWAFFWGIFPDLFAFAIPFMWLIWNIATGQMPMADWPRPEHIEPIGHDGWPAMQLAATLYQYSHSVFVFGIVGVVLVLYRWSRKRRFPLEMFGWPLHILMDIPTHSYRFFPTPFLWPVSQWKFDGFSWAHPAFLLVDYSFLALVFFLLHRKNSFRYS